MNISLHPKILQKVMSPFPWTSEVVAVTAILGMMSLLGIVLNLLAIISVQCNPVKQNPFCILCSSHASAGLGVLLIYLFWVAPLTLRQKETCYQVIGKIMGHLSTIFWYATIYSHMAISINRIIATTCPLKASILFTKQRSFCMVLVVWCIGFCHTISNFWRDSCYLCYSASSWEWKFAESQCGITTAYVAKSNMLLVIIILILDIIVIVRFRKLNKVIRLRKGMQLSTETIKRKQRMEIRLFKQARVTTSINTKSGI